MGKQICQKNASNVLAVMEKWFNGDKERMLHSPNTLPFKRIQFDMESTASDIDKVYHLQCQVSPQDALNNTTNSASIIQDQQ